MKNFFLIAALVIFSSIENSFAQTWSTTGNAGTTPGTNFIGTTDAKDFVFKTNNIEKGRLKSNGQWQFGSTSNLAKIDSVGNLSFSGTAAYKVAANKYAFQYAGNPNYGLFFNAQSLLYEFRTSTAASVFSIGANTGNGIFTGNLKIGAYTLPATDGTSGQILKTNGAGVLTWSADDAGSGTSQWTTSGSNIYYNAGNVGIGTASPSTKLHIVSSTSTPLTIDGATGMFVSINEGGVYRGYFGSYSGAATDVDFGTGGGNTAGKLHLTIQGTPKFTLDASGNVGIGTTTPTSAKLSVAQNSTTISTASFSNTGMGPNISWVHFGSTGDWYLRSAADAGKVILQDQSTSAQVCIGSTQAATGYKLSVDGKIICEEVKVQNSVSWPDFVFDSDYKLPKLSELETHIRTEGHLPGVPSEEEVCDNGISLGEMQATLLQKIEELTLYLIDQQKQIDQLKKENEVLKTSLLK